MHCHNLWLEELSVPCVTPLGKDSRKLVLGFLWTLPHAPFPFPNFALYLFIIISYSYEYNHMLRVLQVLPVNSLTWGDAVDP